MIHWNSLVINNITYFVIFNMVLGAVLLIAVVILLYRVGILNKRYENMMQGNDGSSIENSLIEYNRQVAVANNKISEVLKKQLQLENESKRFIQKVGVVRFNAFDNTGSDLSFAFTLLDANNDGVVLSSIFGRNESRSYAKPISNGESTYFLTEEEKQALKKAKEKFTK